jgi:hypothetical protein
VEHNAQAGFRGRMRPERYELFVSASVTIEDERAGRCRSGNRMERLSMRSAVTAWRPERRRRAR